MSEAVYKIVYGMKSRLQSFSALYRLSYDSGMNGRVGRLKVVVAKQVASEKKNTSVDLHPVVGATVVVKGSVVGGASLVCIT